MANSLAYGFYPPNSMTEARPITRPGQFDDAPWNQSMASFFFQQELDTQVTEDLKEDLKLMQESDADPEQIRIVHDMVQYMLAQLENVAAKIKLEKKNIAEAQKHTTKVSKQQVKKPGLTLVSDQQMNIERGKQTTEVPKQQKNKLRQIAKSGKQTTEVPKQQEKKLRLIINI
ncbi:hypothetical protein TSUD_393290 [Trifolium subterraneum]|uniref:Uncharacterized protein n=1 Tax=Trifolium subterraneum TaxID=3900 RepID=A0A2Z6NUR0_TRISU|nr:hypothetical protein TSUD_393290 [Trifolium subterraneum]